MRHPIQPVVVDASGVARFRENAIVRYLLENGAFGMNEIASLPFDREDREQFAQLIGYSLSGIGDLSYVSSDTLAAAERMAEMGETEEAARIAALESTLETVRASVRDAAAALFQIHPDDLHA